MSSHLARGTSMRHWGRVPVSRTTPGARSTEVSEAREAVRAAGPGTRGALESVDRKTTKVEPRIERGDRQRQVTVGQPDLPAAGRATRARARHRAIGGRAVADQ